MNITYEVHPWTLNYTGQPPATVEMHVAMIATGETGLGYFVDPALAPDQRDLRFSVNGKSVRLQRTWSDDYLNRYTPTHLLSGHTFSVFFHQESQAQEFVAQVLKKSKQLHLDWTLPVEHLVQHPVWGEMSRIVTEVAKSVTRSKASV